MGRDRPLRQCLGTLRSRIAEARVLMVGAGGIGCELLKDLVLTGFGEVHIVDLDTIDLSNLNRQFLFRHEHIKKPKALVAKAVAGRFNPAVKLEAHHANIKDPAFNLAWFQSFSLVFNALDNLDARRHVNRMCLAANVPLIESGTTGFNGQVQVIRKGQTECYDCNSKETPKSFPICTIRSTPSQPIHCIVWAKSYLFTEIFGTSEEDAPDLNLTEDADNAEEIQNLRREAQALKRIRDSMKSPDFARRIFEKVFCQDIERLRSMDDMWKTRKPPETLDYDTIDKEAMTTDDSVMRDDQRVWTVAENLAVFKDSLRRLSLRLQRAQEKKGDGDAPAVLTFDKDDLDTLDFVAASANLRSMVFGIPPRSRFDIKQMAGNIIPAIATTNAMVAGLCVLQAFKVMRQDLANARMVFLTKSVDRIISAERLRPPRPDCPVCAVAQSTIEVDFARATLDDLVNDLLRTKLGYGEEFSVNAEAGTLYDPELDDNLSKKFGDLGIKGDSFLTVIDEDETSPRVNLVLNLTEKSLPADAKPINLPGEVEIPARPSVETNGHGQGQVEAGAEINGHTNGVAPSAGITGAAAAKRKRDEGEDSHEAVQAKKRGKGPAKAEAEVAAVMNGNGNANGNKEEEGEELIVLDGEDAETTGGTNGAIVIDDDD